MSWFRRKVRGILTATSNKRDMPSGLWYKTDHGKFIPITELQANSYVSKEDGFHIRIGSKEYFEILFDKGEFIEIDKNLVSSDPLNFVDTKSYKERLSEAKEKTKLNDAIRFGIGKMNSLNIIIGCMDFSFIGGSMGCVVGEKISRAVDNAIDKNFPLFIISKSGGARMMEAPFSLMQMAKVCAKLLQLSKHKIPYISLLTDPTTGGVSASYAMLGDFNIAEPGALIGFAGPRVIKETIGKSLPKGFQSAEFLLERGFIDFIVDRRDLKKTVTKLLNFLKL